MTLVKEIVAEIVGMFLGDARLTLAILMLVATTGTLVQVAGFNPLVGGGVLVVGCPLLLIENVRRYRPAASR